MSRRRWLTIALLAAILPAGTPSPRRASADDPAPATATAIDPAWVTIAEVEHARKEPGALAVHLIPTTHRATRRRAIVALGRIGNDRPAASFLLRTVLERRDDDLAVALWAAGISGDKALVPDVVRALDATSKHAQESKDPKDPKETTATLAAGIEALGQLADPRADGYVLPYLDHTDPMLRAAAALALMRLGAERNLEALLAKSNDPDPEARKAIAAGVWRVAGARRKARSTKEKPFEGDLAAVERVMPLTEDPDVEVRIFAMRAVNALLPKDVGAKDFSGLAISAFWLRLGSVEKDPRVLADAVSRLAATHTGAPVLRLLGSLAVDSDPLVRETVVEACRDLATDDAKRVLDRMLPEEADARVREGIAVAFSACGDDLKAREVFGRADRPKDESARAVAEMRALMASKAPESLAAAILIARSGKAGVPALEVLLEGFMKKEHPDLVGVSRDLLAHPDAIVRAGAADLAGEKGLVGLLPDLVAAYRASKGREMQDARGSVVGALAKLATPEKGTTRSAEAEAAAGNALAIVREALSDESPTVRLAARGAAEEIASLKDLPEAKEELREKNGWSGLPRPKGRILGLDLSGGAGALSEAEILAVARAMTEQKAGVVLAVEGLGEIRLALDAESAPVDAVGLLLAAAAGTYDGTSWHRVVPAFVIQGADPRGDGSGDAGYSVPDEITTTEFRRGVLGMPKNTKDTGGCQIFLMHCWAPHLDGHYTAFGRAVSGLEVLDRVRVGDRITKASVEAPLKAP